MNQANQSSRSRRFPKTLAEQAKAFGYERFLTERDWEIELKLPRGGVRRILLNAIGMAIAEGPMLGHAYSLEAILPYVRPDWKFKVGRLANGCQTTYIGP
jgi:hypothetical protein